jgi:hypothetical protein
VLNGFSTGRRILIRSPDIAEGLTLLLDEGPKTDWQVFVDNGMTDSADRICSTMIRSRICQLDPTLAST